MKKLVLLIVIVIGIIVAAYLGIRNQAAAPTDGTVVNGIAVGEPSPTSGKMVTGSDAETFSGTIASVNTGCFADAVCSVTVDGKVIVLVTGGRGMDPNAPVGKLVGVESIGDLESMIGTHANVYAHPISATEYTLYGKSEYYVEATGKK